jgi:hypothetical protein
LCRASTSLGDIGKKDVDGRDKPGHDNIDSLSEAKSAFDCISAPQRNVSILKLLLRDFPRCAKIL